jgi:hypothetical protein
MFVSDQSCSTMVDPFATLILSKAGHPWPVTNRVWFKIMLRSDELDVIVSTIKLCNFKLILIL